MHDIEMAPLYVVMSKLDIILHRRKINVFISRKRYFIIIKKAETVQVQQDKYFVAHWGNKLFK